MSCSLLQTRHRCGPSSSTVAHPASLAEECRRCSAQFISSAAAPIHRVKSVCPSAVVTPAFRALLRAEMESLEDRRSPDLRWEIDTLSPSWVKSSEEVSLWPTLINCLLYPNISSLSVCLSVCQSTLSLSFCLTSSLVSSPPCRTSSQSSSSQARTRIRFAADATGEVCK